MKIKWIRAFDSIEKQINATLAAMTLFLIFYAIYGYIDLWIAPIIQIICLFSAVYFLVFSLLLTKKWADKKYK